MVIACVIVCVCLSRWCCCVTVMLPMPPPDSDTCPGGSSALTQGNHHIDTHKRCTDRAGTVQDLEPSSAPLVKPSSTNATLPFSLLCVSCSRAWLLYWMLHSLDLLMVLEGISPSPSASATSGMTGVSSAKAQALLHMDTHTLAHRAVGTHITYTHRHGHRGEGGLQ